MNTNRTRGLLAQNTVLNLVGQLAPMIVGVLTVPYIIKALGTTAYGILSIAFTVLGYFGIFDLGLSRATVRFVAENFTPDRVHRIPGIVWTSLWLLIGLGLSGALVASAAVGFAVHNIFKISPEYITTARNALYFLCASLPIVLTNDALRGVVEATQRFDLVNYVKVPTSIVFYLSAAIAAYLGVTVAGIVLLLVIIRLLRTCAYFIICLRIFPSLRTPIRVTSAAMRPLVSFGGWIMVSNITQPLFGSLERFVIVSRLSVDMLSFYSAPFDLVSKASIFPASIAPALFPYFSYRGSSGIKAVCDITSRSLKYLLLIMTPITTIFVVFSHDILRIWIGKTFAVQSAAVLQLLALAFFMNAFAYIPYSSVQALGRPDLKAVLDLFSLPVYAALSWYCIKKFGITGAAMAKLAITLVDVCCLFAFARRLRAFSLKKCITGYLLRAELVSCAFVAGIVSVKCASSSLWLTAISIVFIIALYCTLCWKLVADEHDKSTIMVVASRITGKVIGEQVSISLAE